MIPINLSSIKESFWRILDQLLGRTVNLIIQDLLWMLNLNKMKLKKISRLH